MRCQHEVISIASEMLSSRRLFYCGDESPEEAADYFRGSITRFSEIACMLENCHSVLDVGGGRGFLTSLLTELGHECSIIDINLPITFFKERGIRAVECNVEVDRFPFEDERFDAVVCGQVLEHFTHSHLPALHEMHRVLKVGGLIEVDVPNVNCFRNRSRMLRGKNITYDYDTNYLYSSPILYKGMSFYPHRHNREFTLEEIRLLLNACDFNVEKIEYLRSTRFRSGINKIKHVGTYLRDSIPSMRKSIIAYGRKHSPTWELQKLEGRRVDELGEVKGCES